MNTEFGMVPRIVALYGFIFSIALWIWAFVIFVKFHLGGGERWSSVGGVRSGLVGGKKFLYRRLLLSLLLKACVVTCFVAGSLIKRVGIRVFAASVGGEEMNLDACQMLVSSRLSNQSIQ